MDESTLRQPAPVNGPTRINKSIDNDAAWLQRTLLLFGTAVFSGLIIALPPQTLPIWLQLNILGHVLIGSVLSLPLCGYVYGHFKTHGGNSNARYYYFLAC